MPCLLLAAGAGGGTYFPKLDKRIAPVRGMAVVFFPCSLGAWRCGGGDATGHPCTQATVSPTQRHAS